MKKLIFCVLALCLYSCQNNKHIYPSPDIDKITYFEDMQMPEVEIYKLQQLPTPEDNPNGAYFVYADTVLIVEDIIGNPEHNVFTCYNLNTLDSIAGIIKRGDGPDEMIGAMAIFRNGNLDVYDVTCNTITSLSVDSILNKKDEYKPYLTHIDELIHDFVFKGDTAIVSNASYVNGFGVSPEVPNFMALSSKTGQSFNKTVANKECFPFDATNRRFFYNTKLDQYFEIWVSFPVINIYDKNFELIKQYKYRNYEDMIFEPVGKDNMLWPKDGNFASFFYKACQTEKYFYVINNNSPSLMSEEEDFTNQEIWCFDYDNNLKRRIKINNPEVNDFLLSVNEQTGNIYLCSANSEEETFLYKLIKDNE